MAGKAIGLGLAVLMLAAGLGLALGYDRLGVRAEAMGLPLGLRVPSGLWQLAAGVLLLWPGRRGYGAAMALVACAAALAEHVLVLGLDSAPPAAVMAAVAAVMAWRHRTDLRR